MIWVLWTYYSAYIDTAQNEENTNQNMIALSTLLYVSCMEIMFLYINFCLKKATYEVRLNVNIKARVRQ